MAMRPATRMVVALLVLMMAFMLGGCLGATRPDTKQRGTMTIIARIPDQFRTLANATVSSVDARITNLVFTLSRGSTTINKSVPVVDGTVEVAFADLLVGTWQIGVVGRNAEGLNIATATSSAYIEPGETSIVTLEMKLATGSLSVTVEFQSSFHITSGTVALLNPIEDPIERDLEISGTSGSALFEDVAAMTWPIRVLLYTSDGSLAAQGEDQVTVAPGDTTHALITIRNGTMIVSITWRLPPSAPAGLRAVVENGHVLLSWTANPPSENVAGYLVYRSTGDSFPLSLVSDSLVTGTSYEDSGTVHGATYQYSVQAFSSDGLSGSLSPRVAAASQQNVRFMSANTICRCGNTGWSLDFIAVRPEGLSIVAGAVTHPSGLTRQMEPMLSRPGNWRARWFSTIPEPGVYVQSVEYDSGESDALMVSIPDEMLTGIKLPEPIAPANHAVLDTLTPILEYQVPPGTDSVAVMLIEATSTQGIWYLADLSGRFQVPGGLLERGKEYKWAVNAMKDQTVNLLLSGVCDEQFFTVE